MTSEHRLLDAVDALTKPTVEHQKQYDDAGVLMTSHRCKTFDDEPGPCDKQMLHVVERPPLLHQLAKAVKPSAGNDGGSKSASARERNVIDSDALWELTKIQTELRDWMRHNLASYDRNDLPGSLRRWYVAYDAQVITSDELTEWHVRELRRWERIIIAKLDRNVKQIPTGYLCVICKDQHWIDPDGERQPARLILSYRRDEDGRTSEEQVTCQRCRTRWDSIGAIEELGQELTEVSERMRT